MRVLMFGWEYPPKFSGGLGVATQGLVSGLLGLGVEVVLVLPHRAQVAEGGLTILDANEYLGNAGNESLGKVDEVVLPLLRVWGVESLLQPYLTEKRYTVMRSEVLARVPIADSPAPPPAFEGGYGPNLWSEVLRYARVARRIALSESFDVIHAHDWITYPAAAVAREATRKPLVVHVHATEYDRTGGPGNPSVSAVERSGFSTADRVICVSRYTAGIVRRLYGIPMSKLRVVYNAIESGPEVPALEFEEGEPLVLFAGRLTFQKGPDYFIEAARLVAAENPHVKFVVAGTGDMLPKLIARVSQLRMGNRILFTGFLARRQLERLYQRADVFVLPSVSEPFGLTVLEALREGVPAIVSRNAGVAEVVHSALRVDFWDVRELASKILSLLSFPVLRGELVRRGRAEVKRITWGEAAERCLQIYREIA
jgi:glycosyltransferase involved in cell wall biosynthesis